MNANEVYLMEFIGKDIKVKNSYNTKNIGINGKLIDESKNMMFINNGIKTCSIPKAGTIFEISFEDKLYNINGDAVLIRPEDRTKEKRKIYKKLRRYEK
ncbi:ribonuclease P protein subunit [Ferroplasma sp.]|uniref:ribonuclease P protein component 1 n=1 Tax=Ferroplasma sp. TaxID=2591003 RepID=UPI00307CF091